ncbi:hypothetical protein KRR26_10930 [Corallococcus sp. M34]|uniref:hypothetical protein n=1 Tax=Citreicoccus inhibens TaxID=2849499 RepID=UPI001C240B2E|nr:hypothetical protein [Citreicoccus inhibens]MBU8896122.1 hypothetical protein [Citreicoccus inhibens]
MFIALGMWVLGVLLWERFGRRTVLAVGTAGGMVALGVAPRGVDSSGCRVAQVLSSACSGVQVPSSMAVMVEEGRPARRGLVMGMSWALLSRGTGATLSGSMAALDSGAELREGSLSPSGSCRGCRRVGRARPRRTPPACWRPVPPHRVRSHRGALSVRAAPS